MKKFVFILTLFPLMYVCFLVYGQDNNNIFKVNSFGKGKQPIVFIPGFACPGDVWDETIQLFKQDFTCYALTMPGFAGVDPQPNPSFKEWETAIASFIQENKIRRPIIVGHSMGGGLAMALASEYPEIVSKIIIVDALPCLPALFNPSFRVKSDHDCSTIVSQITSFSDEQFYQLQKLSAQRMTTDTSKQELVVKWTIHSDRKTFAEMFCDFTNVDLREKISTIRCPSLILLESSFRNYETAINDQFRNLKTANIQYATKGLHFIMYDDKDWYFKQLNSFIRQ